MKWRYNCIIKEFKSKELCESNAPVILKKQKLLDLEDENFKKIFTDIWIEEKEYITEDEDNSKRFHIDLSYVIPKELMNIGVKKIFILLESVLVVTMNIFTHIGQRHRKMKKIMAAWQLLYKLEGGSDTLN